MTAAAIVTPERPGSLPRTRPPRALAQRREAVTLSLLVTPTAERRSASLPVDEAI